LVSDLFDRYIEKKLYGLWPCETELDGCSQDFPNKKDFGKEDQTESADAAVSQGYDRS
jgi:hypothetical protein